MVWTALEIALVLIVFLLHGGLLAPEVNEPNYLGKAKNYWNPEWCAGDAFLESADAHLVFYWTFGWMTLLLPLPVVAVVGRIVTYACLALAWQQLSSAVVPRRGFAVLSAALLVMFNTHFHMAGEWVVGGVEAKGFGYALVFLGFAALVRDRWNRAWIILGVASAVHVLIGGWANIAATFAWFWMSRDERPRLLAMMPALIVGVVISVAGLLPALLLARGANSEIVSRAWRIQVFHRLPHHLNPLKFFFAEEAPYLTRFGMRFLVLVVIWVIFYLLWPRQRAQRALGGIVFGSLSIALVGMLVSLATANNEDLAGRLMRFYWHRTPDVLLPMGVALAVAGCTAAWLAARPVAGRVALMLCVIGASWHLSAEVLDRYKLPVPKADRKMTKTESRYRDWLEICDVAADKLPREARVLTPRPAHTFKWYAGRGEVVIYKEMPQDAASIADWWERFRDVHRDENGWRRLADAAPAELRALGKKYRAGYVVTDAEPRVDLPAVHRNDSFALYKLTE